MIGRWVRGRLLLSPSVALSAGLFFALSLGAPIVLCGVSCGPGGEGGGGTVEHAPVSEPAAETKSGATAESTVGSAAESPTQTPADPDLRRPSGWAVPLEGRPGLPNLHRVSETLYRGAQPGEEGFAALKEMGVKTVVNLRTFHSDRSECEKAGLDYVPITMQAWDGENEELARFLAVAADPSRQPVFVHCQHGADRTGVACAAYRIVIQGWSREAAVAEMTGGGFGFHPVWQNLVEYVENLDAGRLAEMAGLGSGPENAGESESPPPADGSRHARN